MFPQGLFISPSFSAFPGNGKLRSWSMRWMVWESPAYRDQAEGPLRRALGKPMGFRPWIAPTVPFPKSTPTHHFRRFCWEGAASAQARSAHRHTTPAVPRLGDSWVIRSCWRKNLCLERTPTRCQGMGQVPSAWDPSSAWESWHFTREEPGGGNWAWSLLKLTL